MIKGGVVAQTYALRRIPLWPVIRIMFVVFLIIGIIIGIFYAILLSTWGALMSSFTEAGLGGQLNLLRGLGFILIPVIAILYAVFGTIVVAIWSLIYNLIASVVGGFEMTLEPVGVRPAAAAPAGGPAPGAHVPPDKTITGF
jgi:hypothetical protein